MNFRIKLSYKLIAVVLVGGLLPILVLSAFILFFVQEELEGHVGRQLDLAVRGLCDDIDREILKIYRDLTILAEKMNDGSNFREPIIQFLSDENLVLENLEFQPYGCIGVINPEREWVIREGSSCSELSRIDLSDPNYAGVHWVNKANPGFHFKLPIPGSESSKLQLVALVDMRHLSEKLIKTNSEVGDLASLIVFLEDGRIIARRYLSRNLGLNAFENYPILADQQNQNQGYFQDSNSIAVVMKLERLASDFRFSAPWNVAAIQPLDDLSENNVLLAQQIRSGLFITAFLAVITCMGLSILLLSRILEPIKSLIQATKRIQEGDLATPIVVTGSDELAELGTTFNEMMAELRISLAKLRNLATRDELTGLFNRRVFNSRLREEMDRVERYKMPLSLVMIDIDRFKTINDKFGHAFGDKVLREIARVGMESCRTTDLFTRYGGEEFAMIVPQTAKQECLQLTERIRRAIADLKIPFDSSISVSITVSIGVASIPEDASTREELFFLADQALYDAKRAGRNQVCGAGTGKATPESQHT